MSDNSVYTMQRDKADKLLNQQKAIISKYQNRLDFNKVKNEYCFKVDELADTKQNTDLFLFEFKRLRIACRVRFGFESYKYGDFTIRSRAANGGETEIDKINKGYGDYMLYCWTDKSGETITEFVIIDLEEFRYYQCEFLLQENKQNFDNCTAFNTYSIDKMIKTPCCVVANLKSKEIGA